MNKKWTLILVLTLAVIIFIFTACSNIGSMVDAEDSGNPGSPGNGGLETSSTGIFVASDIHYLSKELYDDGEAFLKYSENINGRNFIYIDEVVSAFACEIQEKKPDILIVSGDLTNNGEKINHLRLAEKFMEIEAAAGTKVYIIPGNHDIYNPFARIFSGDKMMVTDNVSPEEFAEIYEEFGYGEAISRDEFSLSYLAAATDKLWLLMIDTNMYYLNEENGVPTTNGVIYEETLDWIGECVEMARENGTKVISVTHHNLLKHSEKMYYGYTLNKNEKVVSRYEDLGITVNLSGHIHAQSIATHEFSKGSDKGTIYDIATATMSSYPNRYAILQYKPGQGFNYDTYSVDVDSWARKMGITDEKLLNFNEYSKNMYIEAKGEKSLARFGADYSISIPE